MPKPSLPPLSLDRSLQLHAAALAILGALFVGLRPDGALLPALTAVAALAAFMVTDVWEWLKLNRWVANVLAIAAVVWSLRQFLQIASEEKLIAIADMLCCLQIVLLFQEKNARVFWQLLVLSVLQLVVAAALDLGPQFGMLVMLYGLTAVSMLISLTIYRESHRQPASQPSARLQPRASWEMLLARPEVTPVTLSDERLRSQLTGGLVLWQTMLLATVTLLFATNFFYATPRLRESSWSESRQARGGRAAFRPEIQLAEQGRIHLSNQDVLRMALSKVSDRKPLSLVGEFYLHGEILTDYWADERGSRWSAWRPPYFSQGERNGRGGFSRAAYAPEEMLVRQDIVVEMTTSNRRFCIAPTQPYRDFSVIAYGPVSRAESQTFNTPRQQRYTAVTPAIQGRRQVRAIPNPNRLQSPEDGFAYCLEEEHALQIDRERFGRLIATAQEHLEQQRLSAASALDKAVALERHFLVPEAYHYSLNLDFERDTKLDPIEDFVANHRTGHCEYFASALVMMLRSQGIPARLVLGYKGGGFNSLGQYYVVQERHAHAWVEAWLPSREIPAFELAGNPSDGGAWYRLDPTPAVASFIALNEGGLGNQLAEAFDYVELIWRDYVQNLNPSRQDEMVFEPLAARTGRLPSWIDAPSFQRLLRNLSRRWGLEQFQRSSRGGPRYFEASLALLVIGGLAALGATIWGTRKIALAVVRTWRRKRRSNRNAPPAFYTRLEQLFTRLSLVRGDGQTPREFAKVASTQLSSTGKAGEAAKIPPEIVTAYYRVRFGGAHLDKNESAAIEQALENLSQAIRIRS